MQHDRKIYLGINLEMDPSVAIVENGKVLAYSEEERHLRIKHAQNRYPEKALKYCLKVAGCDLSDITSIAINWNLTAYNNGTIKAFYDGVRREYRVDAATASWQEKNLKKRSWVEYRRMHERELQKIFGRIDIPPIVDFPHHYTHAFQAYMQSGYDSAVCVTIDGSGDQHCTVVWKCMGSEIVPIHEVNIPHSLGWLYAAITEYLGFQAYDGEYKVMGLAAYGEPNQEIRSLVEKLLTTAPDGIGYRVAAEYVHYGTHTYSGRFTDALVELLGRPPRRDDEPVDQWHTSLAYELQALLERTIVGLVRWAVGETGLSRVCIGGGVGLNVKLNSRLFEMPEVSDVFAHPLCGDSGAACGAALLACYQETGAAPERLRTLALGYEEGSARIEELLKITKVTYESPTDIAEAVAAELELGRVVGWFQGRMEGGPRALGQRSILANPTQEAFRDRVNAIVKFREEWRPFCPSMLEEYADKYFDHHTCAPFMIMAFRANEALRRVAPAIVHVDGTARVQFVSRETAPLYHRMINAFRRRTGVPVVLNTSFNVKGEPIVCTALDALRTFWGSGIDVLAIGEFLIRKPVLEQGK
jgi:carbamoyltransferase